MIEDSHTAAEIVRRRVRSAALPNVHFMHAPALESGLELLDQGWDVLLLDLGLPGCTDLDALERVRAVAPQLTIVVLTAHDDPSLAMRALAAGAQDYLVKSRIDSDSLARAIRYAIGRQSTLRRSEELRLQLERSERLAAIGQLAAGVAHEINNPLAYATVNLELALRELRALVDSGHHVGSTIARLTDASDGVTRVVRIVRDLSRFARVDPNAEPIPIDFNRSVESALNMAASHLKYRATVHVELREVPRVLAPDGRLSQIFVNLLVNAGQAIVSGPASANRIEVRTYVEAGEVVFTVRDTGQGIAPEHLERVFDPFFSTKKPGEGSGLGLSICRSLLEACGGTIEIESELGSGTTVWVRLPAYRGEAAPQPTRPLELEGAARRGRVLVIDDELAILRAMTDALAPEHDVTVASSGDAARAILLDDARFDAVLCDLVMVNGTGVELFRWVETSIPSLVPAMLLMTGGILSAEARELVAQHATKVVHKPIEIDALRRRIGEVVRGIARTPES